MTLYTTNIFLLCNSSTLVLLLDMNNDSSLHSLVIILQNCYTAHNYNITMPQTSKWGNIDLKPRISQEHKEVEKAIFDKLCSLGPDAKDADGKELRPDDIHKLDKSWQPYNARSFGNAVKRCRKMIGKYQNIFYYLYVFLYLYPS